MIEMNAYYAHDSAVGAVFDLACWSGRKSFARAIVGLVSGCAFLACAFYVWNPSWFSQYLPAARELAETIAYGHRHHRWTFLGGISLSAMLGVLCVLSGAASLGDCFARNYYLRAGAEGLALRVPYGLSWSHFGLVSRVLDLQLEWSEIRRTTITQVKQLGALSRHSGNVGADLKIELRSGKTFEFGLDGFDSPAYLIHERLEDAKQTVPARFESSTEHASLSPDGGRNASHEFAQTL